MGDVFLIPIDDSRHGIGQIAGDWKGELYVIIFDAVYGNEAIDPKRVLAEKPLFGALSLDAKIHHGDWRVIGNISENLAAIRYSK